MVDKVRVATEFTADAKGYISGAKASEKSAKELQKEFDKATRAADKQERQVKKTGDAFKGQASKVREFTASLTEFAKTPAGIATAFGVATAGLTSFVKAQASAIDQLGKLVPVTNSSVEALSQYRHVADLSGVSFNKLTDSFTRLNRRLGSGSAAVEDAVEALNLDLGELQKLRTDQSFERIADALNKIENPAQRAAIAFDLFGRSGVDLLRITEQGSAGIRAMREEADELGLTISEEVAQDAADFNDNLARLQASVSSTGESIAEDLIPIGNDLLEVIIALIPKIKALTEGFGNLYTEAQTISASFVDLVAQSFGLKKAVTDIGIIDRAKEFKAFNDALKASIPQIDRMIQSIMAGEEEEKNLAGAADEKTRAIKSQKKAVEEAIEPMDSHVRALEDFEEAERIAALEAIALTSALEDSEEAIDSFIQEVMEGNDELKTGKTAVEEYKGSVEDLTKAFLDAGLAAAGAAISGGSFNDAARAALPILGRAAGGAAGGFFTGGSPAGIAAGQSIGSFAAGLLTDIFGGGNKTPTIKLQTSPGASDIRLGRTGDTGFQVGSDLSNIVLAGSQGRAVPGGERIVRAIQEMDNRIAESLNPEQLAAAQRAAAFSAKDSATGFDFEQRLIERTRAIFDGIGGEMDAAFDMLASEADLTAGELEQIVDGLTAINLAIQDGTISEEFPGSVDEIVAVLDELKNENETLLQTYNRVVVETAVVESSLAAIGHSMSDVGPVVATAIAEMAGGIERLSQLTQTFRSEFLTEEQRSEIDQAIAQTEVDKFVEDMGDLLDATSLTREGFADFVLSLDLTTEAGQKAYLAALEVADSLDVLLDAEEAAAAGIYETIDPIDKLGDKIDRLSGVTVTAIGDLFVLNKQIDNVSKTTRGVVKVIRQLEGPTREERADAIVEEAIARSASFAPDLTTSTQLQVAALQKLIGEANRALARPRQLSRDELFLQQLILARARDALAGRRGTLQSLSLLESQFPGLGEQRFNLMQEFPSLFDGTELTQLERATGWAEFRERWREIVEGAADSILEPLETIDQRAGDISSYLNSVLLGDFSTLSQQQQLELARSNFFDLATRAQRGEDVTSGELTSAHQALIREIRESFGFGPQATQRFNEATEALANVGIQIAQNEDQQLLVDQLVELRALVSEMRQLREAVEANSQPARAL